MDEEMSDFSAGELTRILQDVKACVVGRDWGRLEEVADDLKVWCQRVRKEQKGNAN